MRTENINHAFLDGVVSGKHDDVYYHFGAASGDDLLKPLRGVKAVVTAGPRGRIKEFASRWSVLNGGAPIVAFPKEDRFIIRYTAGVLFASHGMGMPGASIAIQELMRMLFFLKAGDEDAMDEVIWVRVGTSGGVGLPDGSVVVSTEGLMADLKPYRLLRGGDGEYWFDGTFPAAAREAIIKSNASADISVVPGKTVTANDFFLEQHRLDGAICMENAETKTAWLQWLHDNGVRNIEMEGAMLAGYLNYWGFSKFAMICATVINRLEGDQFKALPAQLQQFIENSGIALFNYLSSALLSGLRKKTIPQQYEPDWELLRRTALEAMRNSYSPYSHFPVGAAGLTSDGRMVRGANVENASLGLTLCAECSMISHLQASGGGKLIAVYCVDAHGNTLMPCGRCRQLLFEHGGPDLLLMTPEGVLSMAELLPQAFGQNDLLPI